MNKNPINFANYDADDKALNQLINEGIPDDQKVQKALFVGADLFTEDPNFDPQAKKDKMEDEALKKIEGFKNKFSEMKDKADNTEQELAYSQVKLEELIKKIKEVDKKREEFKEQLFNEIRENQEMRRKITD